MPLPSDEKLLSLSRDVLQQFETIFGSHPGFRTAHAKGTMLSGTFTPNAEAASFTRAPHATSPVTRVLARFSDATGLPMLPDGDPNANPRGLAVRFLLGDHVHTDVISHSADGFPTRTGQEFLEFLRAAAAAGSSPSALQGFLGSHPAALAYVQMPKPAPSSFAREQFFGVTAMRFINAKGVVRCGRYRIVPDAGVDHLDDAAASSQPSNFLFEELSTRLGSGPIGFRILVQVAQDGDPVNDATVHWPEDRQLIEFGHLQLTGIVPASEQEQQKIIFDPIPRVDGIEPSDDPLLELRAAVYLISGRRRRQAPMAQASGSV